MSSMLLSASCSAWVIWPTFSSRVICASSLLTCGSNDDSERVAAVLRFGALVAALDDAPRKDKQTRAVTRIMAIFFMSSLLGQLKDCESPLEQPHIRFATVIDCRKCLRISP